MTKIIDCKNPNNPPWLMAFLKYLPRLLMEVLRPQNGLSLERMQLVSLQIKLPPKDSKEITDPNWIDIKIEKKPDHMVTLSGTLIQNESVILYINIDYFLRGQKQYYQHLPIQYNFNTIKEFAIDHDEVNQFFNNLMLENDYFLNQNLAQLNGHKKLPVPSLVLITLLLNMLANEMAQKKACAINFYSSAFLDEKLTLSESCHDGHNFLGLLTQSGLSVLASFRGCETMAV
jgi:hypothetical protein